MTIYYYYFFNYNYDESFKSINNSSSFWKKVELEMHNVKELEISVIWISISLKLIKFGLYNTLLKNQSYNIKKVNYSHNKSPIILRTIESKEKTSTIIP